MNRIKKSLFRKKRKKENWFKYIMSVSHLWLGLLSSIIIFTVCLTGSIYAFKNQVEDLVNYKAVFVSEIGQKSISPDTLVADFEKRYGTATTIKLFPKSGNRSVMISSFSRDSPGVVAYYHPGDGRFLSLQGKSCAGFFEFILELHRFLLAGDVGKLINGIAVFIFVFMLMSGFVLWLPKKLKNLYKSMKIRWNARFYRLNYDLHNVLGFYVMVFLMFIAITGLYVSFHWVKNLMIVGLGGDPIVISESNMAIKKDLSVSFNNLLKSLEEEQKEPSSGTVNLKNIVDRANRELPYDGNLSINLPSEQVKNFRVTKMYNMGAFGLIVPDIVEFTPAGEIRKTIKFDDLPLHEQFKAIAKPLHTGEIMGLPSIILYFIASFIGCTLPITGFIIWWKKS